MFWIILGLIIVAFTVFRVLQIRARNGRLADLAPFDHFTTEATNTLKKIAPPTWRTSRDFYLSDRDHALVVLNEFIDRGSSIEVPARQQVYRNAFLTVLSSSRDEWSGYPYDDWEPELSFDRDAEFAARQAQTAKSLAFYSSVKRVMYPPDSNMARKELANILIWSRQGRLS